MKKAYRIVYDHDTKLKNLDKTIGRIKRLGMLSVLFTLIFLLAAFPSFTHWVRSILIADDGSLAILAVDRFTQSLEQNGNLSEAFDVFCATIIDGEG